MDANLQTPENEFEAFLKDCSLTDVIATFNDGTPTATHKKGGRHNVILCSDWILQFIDATGSFSTLQGPSSDHPCVYIDLIASIFDRNPDAIAPSSRGFTTKHKKKASTFGKEVDSALRKNETLQSLLEA